MPQTQTQTKENYELVLYRLDQIDKKLDAMSKNYVTNDVFEAKIDELEDKIRGMQKTRNIVTWIHPIIASLVTAVVTFLLIDYLKRK